MTRIILTLLNIAFLLLGQSSNGQTNGSVEDKKKSNDRKTLIYSIVGDGCPPCNPFHPEKEFGFTIECVGCIRKKEYEKSNSETSKELDLKYGSGWTMKYIKSYCDKWELPPQKNQN